MQSFKHVPRRYAEAFASGESISICTYSYYRNMEGDRGDPFEGIAINYQSDGDYMSGSSKLFSDFNAHTGGAIVQGDASRINFIGCKFRAHLSDNYIFCSSLQPDFERAESEDEVIFCIKDTLEFARRVHYDNRKILGYPRVERVKYRNPQAELGVEDFLTADPFFKNEQFAFENEVRAVFEGLAAGPPQQIVRAPYIPHLVERCDRM